MLIVAYYIADARSSHHLKSPQNLQRLQQRDIQMSFFPLCRNARNPMCRLAVLNAAMTVRISYAQMEMQEVYDAALPIVMNANSLSAMVSPCVAAVRAIRNIEHGALEDLRGFCSIDLRQQQQSLINELTQHVTEAVGSLYAAVRVRVQSGIGAQSAQLYSPFSTQNPPGTIIIQPDGLSDVPVNLVSYADDTP